MLPTEHPRDNMGYYVFTMDEPELTREEVIWKAGVSSVTDPRRPKINHWSLDTIFSQAHTSHLSDRCPHTMPSGPHRELWKLTEQPAHLMMNVVVDRFAHILKPSVYFRVRFRALGVCTQVQFCVLAHFPAIVLVKALKNYVYGLMGR